ncbi:MAG: YggS family pyridoxal phosphate-dependent enzyme [Planctomycetes bacterium]|nr:YggS family pyridoxal phosphate-dependent enzyme [Planctomycetota bacterium]
MRRQLDRCREAVEQAALRAGRDAAEIQTIAVTKYADADVIEILFRLGVHDFGENRVQELLRKTDALAHCSGARFHLIGHLQRNKVAKALPRCASIHSVDSVRLVEEIRARIEARGDTVPDLYVEVNISGEARKTGAAMEETAAILESATQADSLRGALRGLMGMAPYSDDPEESRPFFRRLREMRDELQRRRLLPADAGLSMGMSGDFAVAVEEGATVLRIGSMLFEEE